MITLPNGNHEEFVGRVFAVYQAQTSLEYTDENKTNIDAFMDGSVVSLFSTRRSAERYIDKRKESDKFRQEYHVYSIVPWMVQK
jgi:hypothetical protein